jgi:hypothetical protein
MEVSIVVRLQALLRQSRGWSEANKVD